MSKIPWSKIFTAKLTAVQYVKKFFAFCGAIASCHIYKNPPSGKRMHSIPSQPISQFPIQYYNSIYLQVSHSSYSNYSVICTYAPMHATSCINTILDYFITVITCCEQCSPIHGDIINHRRQTKMTFWQQKFVRIQIINLLYSYMQFALYFLIIFIHV